jgi:hypothetical protein
MKYQIKVRPSRSYAPPTWLVELRKLDPEYDIADLGDNRWEIGSTQDISSIAHVGGVVHLLEEANDV